MINITGYIRAVPTSESAATITIAEIPKNLAPTRQQVINLCWNDSANTIHPVVVQTSGQIQVRQVVKTTASSQVFRINLTYPGDF